MSRADLWRLRSTSRTGRPISSPKPPIAARTACDASLFSPNAAASRRTPSFDEDRDVTRRTEVAEEGSAKGAASCTEEVQPEDDREPVRRFVPVSHVPFRRMVRRAELRKIVPLADTTIYELEQRGEFPQRFFLTSRCVVWDLAEIEEWIEERRRMSGTAALQRAPTPDVRQRKSRPVRHK